MSLFLQLDPCSFVAQLHLLLLLSQLQEARLGVDSFSRFLHLHTREIGRGEKSRLPERINTPRPNSQKELILQESIQNDSIP